MAAKQKIEIGEIAELEIKIGRKAKLTFNVKVLDIKELSYGHTRYVIEPVAGYGTSLVQNLKKKK